MSNPEKKNLRHVVLGKRLKLAPERVRELSEIIEERLLKSSFWPESGHVGLYSSIQNEVETITIFQQAIEKGLHVYFPRVEGGIWYYEVNGPEDLQRGAWGVLEPVMDCEPLQDDASLDLLIVPGVVFSEDCFRVGYGRGLYDKFLLRAPMKMAVGLAYELQMVKSFPTDPWDVCLDAVVAERSIYTNKSVV